tara:strand:- start:133 stop:438 length:306 start_codon:yes stop_codon:yes gene_type:complete
MIERLMSLFRVRDKTQLFVVFLVFSITGTLSMFLGKYVLSYLFGPGFEFSRFYWLWRLLLIFPLYQILLILVGSLFGEFKYFWNIEKKILKKMGLIKSSGS